VWGAFFLGLALVIEGVGYGLYLAWRSVIRGFRGGGLKPQATDTPPRVSPDGTTGTRSIVPDCALFRHPHVHTLLGSGKEICEEQAAAINFPKLQLSKPGTFSIGEGLAPDKIGHYRWLVGISFASLLVYALFYVSEIFTTNSVWFYVPYVVSSFAGAEVVWEDAKAINNAIGAKEIAAGWWSLFAFMLTFVGVPVYAFERRKNVLKQITQSPMASAEVKRCSKCGAAIREGALFCTNCGTALR
jgi:hypothetical protein